MELFIFDLMNIESRRKGFSSLKEAEKSGSTDSMQV